MNDIIYQNEFVFNELEYFSKLFDQEGVLPEAKEKLIEQLQIQDIDYKITYTKDKSGYWYRTCYKNNEKVNWNLIPLWIRDHIWDFETKNRMFQ